MQASDLVRLELPANGQYLNLLAVCIGEMLSRVDGMTDPQQTIYNIQLAVHEGCTNIVDHAYAGISGRIVVTLTLNPNPLQLIVELFDSGRPFTPPDHQPIPGVPQVRGYGLFLMHEIMDDVKYESLAGHNCWRLVKNLVANPVSSAS